MSLGYSYALDRSCCERMNELSRRDRARLIDIFRVITDHPFAKGDYQQRDARGLELEVKLMSDRFVVTWRTDHAAKEVRIVELDIV